MQPWWWLLWLDQRAALVAGVVGTAEAMCLLIAVVGLPAVVTSVVILVSGGVVFGCEGSGCDIGGYGRAACFSEAVHRVMRPTKLFST